jgi:hypothetical protein
MDEVKVEVVELEIVEGTLAGFDDGFGGVAVVPDFGVDPEIGARDAAAHDLAEGTADLLLVSINGGAVEVAVAGGRGTEDGFGGGFVGNVVGSEGAEADDRDLAGRHLAARHAGSIHGGDGGGGFNRHGFLRIVRRELHWGQGGCGVFEEIVVGNFAFTVVLMAPIIGGRYCLRLTWALHSR